MAVFEYEGRDWHFATPGPSFALEVRRLADVSDEALGALLLDHLIDWMDLDDWVWFARHQRDLPEDAVPELFMRWLEETCGKPMSAVAALSNVIVRSWGMVQGRLIQSGIPDPLKQIPTLAGLINAVDVMIREGHQDEKATKKYEREVYKPRAKSGTISKPAGFEKEDMAAQMAMLDALGD